MNFFLPEPLFPYSSHSFFLNKRIKDPFEQKELLAIAGLSVTQFGSLRTTIVTGTVDSSLAVLSLERRHMTTTSY